MKEQGSGGALDCFRRYAQAFQSLDPKAVAQFFYEPSLLITPHGVTALATSAEVERAYARIMADLPAQGYARTEFAKLDERQLSRDLAVVTGGGAWKKVTGEDFAHFGMTYTLRRAGDAWRIIVAIIHDPSSS